MWENDKDFHSIIRCTNIQYGEPFINQGTIKFNTPQNWVDYYKENKIIGRGDILEGTFAACEYDDIRKVMWYRNKYPDVNSETINGITYFRRENTMSLPCLCFLALEANLFKFEDNREQKLTGVIEGLFFRDFMDGKSEKEVMRMEEHQRPMVVLIKDKYLFFYMLKEKLSLLGVKDHEIMISPVSYRDKSKPFFINNPTPDELFCKDVKFSHQHECRVVIDTKSKKVKRDLLNNTVNIGDLRSITFGIKAYFEHGVSIELGDLY